MTTNALFTFLKLKMTARLNTTMNIVLQSVTLFAHGVAYDKNNRHRGHIYSFCAPANKYTNPGSCLPKVGIQQG